MDPQGRELKPEQLRAHCDPGQFKFQSTADLGCLEDMIGQERAKRSLSFGVDVPGAGFNIFVMGETGTGRWTMVNNVVGKRAAGEPAPDDWLYVNNFRDENKPHALRLPAGRGCELRRDMDDLIGNLQRAVPQAFESEEYEQQKARIGQQLQDSEGQLFSQLQKQAEQRGFGLARTPAGIALVRTEGGKPISESDYERMPQRQKQAVDQAENDLQLTATTTAHQAREEQKRAQEALRDLDRQVVAFATGHFIDDLEAKYADLPQVKEYLQQVRADVQEHVEAFQPVGEQAGPMGQMLSAAQETAVNRYRANLLVDNCAQKSAPVVTESNPTYSNLVGQVQQEAQFGALVTDFTMIRAGAFHRANGGYLLLEARDLFTNPFSYEALKRILKDGRIEIDPMGEQLRLFNTTTLEPEPIPVNTKVVLVGEPWIYYVLYEEDPEFRQQFKVMADFGAEIKREQATIDEYAQFVATRCHDHALRPFDPTGVAALVEQGSRLAEDQKKLTAHFSAIGDLAVEASYWGGQAGHNLVTGDDVHKAIDEKIYRHSRIEERIREMIERGTILVDTEGAVVGQVNGLSVSMFGDYEFGRPSRITARTYIGRGNVVAIDRVVAMAGPIHNKGVLILAGYLGGRFAQDRPLSLSASLTFEQSYEGVEGDSASSAELYALLSSLSSLPLRQDLAVTGSVNQRGEVQPIGGANAKIEGFYDVCKTLGLTGSQGVIIPSRNVDNLMLRDDVIQAVRDGKFHVYSVETIDQGIELLTGVQAGALVDGRYPSGTVNYRVNERLTEMARIAQSYAQPEEEHTEAEPTPVH